MDDNQKIKIIKRLKNRDYLLLRYLYYYRCLNIQQAWGLCYKSAGIDIKIFIQKRVVPFIRLNIVSLSHSGKSYVLTITNDGIDILSSKISLNNDFFDTKTKKIRSGVMRESQIKILPRLMEHQLSLNQFVIDFSERMKKNRFKDYKYNYFDEKFMSKYPFIRPDGMISIPSLKLDLFLEMDMGTESKKQLIEKWSKYRIALNMPEIQQRSTKIIVLFILDNLNTDKIEARKSIVRYSIDQTLIGDYDDNLDIYIGTKYELMKALFEKILPMASNSYPIQNIISKLLVNKYGYKISNASNLKKIFYSSSYAFYVRKMTSRNKILVKNGKVQEFLFDDYFYEPLSVLNRIQYHTKHSSLYELNYKRPIDYIVLVQSLDTIYRDLSITNSLDIKSVYYTTIERLLHMPLPKALIQFDCTGNIYHFTDETFRTRVLEDNIDI